MRPVYAAAFGMLVAWILVDRVSPLDAEEARAESGQPAFRFARIFTDNLILQRDARLPVWGWAEPGKRVTVGFRDQRIEAGTDRDGKWMVWLDPLPACRDPQSLTATCQGVTRTLVNVLVGEVWIAAGQSNMERIFTIDIKDFHNPKLSPAVRETWCLFELHRPGKRRSSLGCQGNRGPAVCRGGAGPLLR